MIVRMKTLFPFLLLSLTTGFASAKELRILPEQIHLDGREAIQHVLAVRAEGDHLDLVEVYYPSEAQETRYGDGVKAMLAGGAA